METKIKEYIDSPEQLEKLYMSDRKRFEEAFLSIYDEISDNKISAFWKARIEYGKKKTGKTNGNLLDILILVISCLTTGFLIKFPDIFGIKANDFLFYEKNAAFIIFFGLSAYFLLTNKLTNKRRMRFPVLIFILSVIYINLLPSNRDSHSITLVFMYMPLFLWCLFGLMFIDFDIKNKERRIDYIRFNGEIVILASLMLFAGIILTLLTINLFSAIGLNIEKFYIEYIVVIGLVSSPIVATYITKNYPGITDKIAPIIATIFSPLVLVTLIIYLGSIIIVGKDPYSDRDFLITFNLTLLGVVAVMIFSIAESQVYKRRRFNEITLLALTVVAIIVDLIALSAILYRLNEFGFTPNKTAMLGANLLILGNLILIMIDLFKVNFRKYEIKNVEMTMAGYIPIYAVWTIIVIFILPLIFGFK